MQAIRSSGWKIHASQPAGIFPTAGTAHSLLRCMAFPAAEKDTSLLACIVFATVSNDFPKLQRTFKGSLQEGSRDPPEVPQGSPWGRLEVLQGSSREPSKVLQRPSSNVPGVAWGSPRRPPGSSSRCGSFLCGCDFSRAWKSHSNQQAVVLPMAGKAMPAIKMWFFSLRM